MKINSTITIYEIDGKEVYPLVGDNIPKLEVKSHWNRKALVILMLDNKEIAVSCDDLSRAIRASESAHPY